MLSQDTFKNLLIFLQFKEEEKDIFTKKFQNDVYIKADFEKKILIYPEDKGFTMNERQTCNFSSAENFVVFECVHRLFEKGYKPEHIELEPKWKLGHGASGGRADILVKSQEKDEKGEYKPLLLIECKTAGKEFDKAWKDTQQDGGQLFTYVQQIQETQFLCLYASDFNEKLKEYADFQKIISHKDNQAILEQDNQLKSFEKAQNVKQRYEVWKNTYKLEFTKTGIFEENILPYQIGKNEYTLDIDTKPLSSIDKKGLYHIFRTILRKYNVSRRENAFDILVNLFICKIIDEKENKTKLKFFWKGIAYDNYYDLVDRLQELYKIGMQRFLEEDVLYVSNDEIDKAFWTTKTNRNATKKRIKEIFTELKFFKGLDFEFIKVNNKKGFDKNAKILIEIVQMWQSVRLGSQNQNQFLGDMFEYFLDNGIKQTEGQFFTPIPICKFVLASLPLEQKIKQKSEPLKAIDYACGSGHFLNEYAIAIKPLVEKYKQTNITDYYKEVFGIEKEDRLAKVAKVSACMYGQNEIQVLDTDALVSNPKIKEESFDVLVANPPFAVKDFLMTLEDLGEKELQKFQLFKENETNLESNNIQCFFLERAKHLLAPDAVAGIIVPTSVLSNSDEMHIQTREILLKYFDIISLVELGSGTFGKTGTNTVVLFLRRNAQKPEQAEHFWNRTLDYFENGKDEINANGGVYQDLDILKKYCSHIEIPFETYSQLLNFTDFENLKSLWEFEIFKEYKNAFDKATANINLQKSTIFKKKTPEQQQKELHKTLINFIHEIEKQKFYFFMLAYHNPQKVLVVKSPQDNKDQKNFLGYEWSNSKGNEGIKYNGGDTVYDIITPMFNPNDRNDETKISYWIIQNFENKQTTNTHEFMQYTNLTDMLDFTRTDFNKALAINTKKKIVVESKWEMVKLGDICILKAGGTPSRDKNDFWRDGTIKWLKINDFKDFDEVINTEEKITELGLKNSSAKILDIDTVIVTIFATIGRIAIIKEPMTTNQAIVGLEIKDKNKLLPYYLMNAIFTNIDVLKAEAIGMAQPNINSSKLSSFKIPLPPLEIQEKIVVEIEEFEKNKNQFLIDGISLKDFEKLIKEKKNEIIKKYL